MKTDYHVRHMYYGYWVLAVSFLIISLVSGCGVYVFSLFINPIHIDLGWGIGSIMAANTIWYSITGIASPFIGKYVDRFGAKIIIALGATFTGLGFFILCRINTIWQFYIGYAVVGTGMSAMGQIPISAVISKWFTSRRGLSIGAMAVGTGIGGFIMSPLVGRYLIPNYGWRISYYVLGILIWLTVLPASLLIIKEKTQKKERAFVNRNFLPKLNAAQSINPHVREISYKKALNTKAFWIICITFLFSNMAQVGIFQSQVPYLIKMGFSSSDCAVLLAGFGLSSASGKFIFGSLCDIISPKNALIIGLTFQLVALFMLMSFSLSSSEILIVLYTILMGLGVGSWLPTMSMLVSTNFGMFAYGSIFGTINLFYSFGCALGPLLTGIIYEMMETYRIAYSIFIAFYLISIITISLIKQPRNTL